MPLGPETTSRRTDSNPRAVHILTPGHTHCSTSVIPSVFSLAWSFACLSNRDAPSPCQVFVFLSIFLILFTIFLCDLLALCGSSIPSPTLVWNSMAALSRHGCLSPSSPPWSLCAHGFYWGRSAPLLKVLEALVQLAGRASADPNLTHQCRESITKAIINCQQVRKLTVTAMQLFSIISRGRMTQAQQAEGRCPGAHAPC